MVNLSKLNLSNRRDIFTTRNPQFLGTLKASFHSLGPKKAPKLISTFKLQNSLQSIRERRS